MGGCLSKKPPIRVVMIGLDSAGKTTMLFRLKTNKVVPTIPTVGFNAEEVQVSGISILMWDLGGQAKIRSLWEHYTQDISGVVFVVDASDKGRLKEAHDEMYRILRSPDLSKVKPLLIMANKQDQPSSMSAQEVRAALGCDVREQAEGVDGEPWPLEGRSCYVQECCALSGAGIQQGLEWLLKQLGEKK